MARCPRLEADAANWVKAEQVRSYVRAVLEESGGAGVSVTRVRAREPFVGRNGRIREVRVTSLAQSWTVLHRSQRVVGRPLKRVHWWGGEANQPAYGFARGGPGRLSPGSSAGCVCVPSRPPNMLICWH